MSLTLYSHPFSSYSQKVLVALWENEIPFAYRHMEHPGVAEERTRLWPLARFPILVDNGRTIVESSIIIEHLDLHHARTIRLLPTDPDAALEVRFMDRFFDNYVMTTMQKPVFEALRPQGARTEEALAEAAKGLETAYTWLESKLSNRTWATGENFTMADCAAAPALFYADWVHQIGTNFPHLRAYRTRLLDRPSFARAVEEARPYRHYFPLGAPDRD
jgi:glutathione S-transferase